MTSLVPDANSMGHNSSTSLSMSYWVTSRWLLSFSRTEFPNDDKIRLDDHYGSSYHNILQIIHSQSLPQPPTDNGHYLGRWSFSENLLLVLAQSPLHIHPFQFKHPGWPLLWKSLCFHSGQGLFSLESPWMALDPGLVSMGNLPPHHHHIRAITTQQNSGDCAGEQGFRKYFLPNLWIVGFHLNVTPHGDLQKAMGSRGRGMGSLELANIVNITN